MYPYPVIVSACCPELVMMKAESRPVGAPLLPMTRPPKSSSFGEIERKGLLETSLPSRLTGREFEYFATPLVV